MTIIDLNRRLADIVECDEALKEATAFADRAEADRRAAVERLAAAQEAFDVAVANARGKRPAAPVATAPAASEPEEPAEIFPADGPIPMGPLPPTSPALKDRVYIAPDTGADDDREDQTYDAPGS